MMWDGKREREGEEEREKEREREKKEKLSFPDFLINVYVSLEAQCITISLFLFDKH